MKALVIYDSFFGNTEKIGKAVAEVLGAKTLRISEAKPEDIVGLDLLVVGSPTRAFRPSPNTTKFINSLPSLNGMQVTAFDTRIDPKDIKSKTARSVLGSLISLFGYAAKPIANKLVKLGGKLAGEPEGFYVLDSEGPLREGELERAKKWANSLADK